MKPPRLVRSISMIGMATLFLIGARKIYQDAGFALVKTEPHRSWGQNLIGETWEREL